MTFPKYQFLFIDPLSLSITEQQFRLNTPIIPVFFKKCNFKTTLDAMNSFIRVVGKSHRGEEQLTSFGRNKVP